MTASETKDIHISVPEHLLEEWNAEAEQMGISRSRWVREHTEAGRKQLAALDPRSDTDEQIAQNMTETVLDVVPEDEVMSEDKIVEEVVNPIQEEIYDILEELSDENSIRYDTRQGGFQHQ